MIWHNGQDKFSRKGSHYLKPQKQYPPPGADWKVFGAAGRGRHRLVVDFDLFVSVMSLVDASVGGLSGKEVYFCAPGNRGRELVSALFRYFAIKPDSKRPHIQNLSGVPFLIICFQ